MKPVTRAGPQPPSCVVEDCDHDPAPGDVMCSGHLKLAGRRGGSLSMSIEEPPIAEPDDRALLEREAKKAAAQEQKEWAERRRVKTWKTLDNGSRVPEEYWTDRELAAMDAEAEQNVARLAVAPTSEVPAPPDPAAMEPVWKDGQWVLRPKQPAVDLERVRDLVRELARELGLS